MKSADEIKKGLDCCADGNVVCSGTCVYDDDENLIYPDCMRLLMTNALVLIQQLEAENAQQARCIENMTDMLNAAHAEAAKLQAERDAAVKDMTKIVQEYGEPCCEYCGADYKPDCTGKCWTHNEGFKWLGVQKEE